MARLVLVSLAILGLGAAQAPAPATWQIDPNHTAARFSVRHMMVSMVRGTLGKVTGTIEYDGTSVQSIRARVAIDVAGLDTGVAARDQDLRSANFFDAATYPTLTFTSTRVEPASGGHFRLIGRLTMHGVTKDVALDVEGPSPSLRQNGTLRIGASATTTLNRRDYGLLYNKMIEAAPIVGDDIQVTIDLEAVRRTV